MRWPWRLHREWNDRVTQARADVEQSRTDLERTREQVVIPLSEYRQRNHFAALIADSLQLGKKGPPA